MWEYASIYANTDQFLEQLFTGVVVAEYYFSKVTGLHLAILYIYIYIYVYIYIYIYIYIIDMVSILSWYPQLLPYGALFWLGGMVVWALCQEPLLDFTS